MSNKLIYQVDRYYLINGLYHIQDITEEVMFDTTDKWTLCETKIDNQGMVVPRSSDEKMLCQTCADKIYNNCNYKYEQDDILKVLMTKICVRNFATSSDQHKNEILRENIVLREQLLIGRSRYQNFAKYIGIVDEANLRDTEHIFKRESKIYKNPKMIDLKQVREQIQEKTKEPYFKMKGYYRSKGDDTFHIKCESDNSRQYLSLFHKINEDKTKWFSLCGLNIDWSFGQIPYKDEETKLCEKCTDQFYIIYKHPERLDESTKALMTMICIDDFQSIPYRYLISEHRKYIKQRKQFLAEIERYTDFDEYKKMIDDANEIDLNEISKLEKEIYQESKEEILILEEDTQNNRVQAGLPDRVSSLMHQSDNDGILIRERTQSKKDLR